MHAALQASLTLVPSGRSKLFGVLKQNYPHRRLKAEILSDYALHALRVVQYAPLIEVRGTGGGGGGGRAWSDRSPLTWWD